MPLCRVYMCTCSMTACHCVVCIHMYMQHGHLCTVSVILAIFFYMYNCTKHDCMSPRLHTKHHIVFCALAFRLTICLIFRKYSDMNDMHAPDLYSCSYYTRFYTVYSHCVPFQSSPNSRQSWPNRVEIFNSSTDRWRVCRVVMTTSTARRQTNEVRWSPSRH